MVLGKEEPPRDCLELRFLTKSLPVSEIRFEISKTGDIYPTWPVDDWPVDTWPVDSWSVDDWLVESIYYPGMISGQATGSR